ncbi:hypothetical protein NIES4102_26500 [Chondrocystis sp. NIES-4102]|nr:hypothetical protein NIES4102_26500 [Chondrocystis sp. NIES-4102]
MSQKQLPTPSLGDKLIQGAPLAVILVLCLVIIYQLRSVLEIIAIAILLSLILQTILYRLEKLLKLRWLAILILAISIICLTILFPIVIIPELLQEFQKLSLKLPEYLSNLTQQSQNLHLKYHFIPNISQPIAKFNHYLDNLVKYLPQLLEGVLGITLEAFATVILALYISFDPQFLVAGLLRVTPRCHHQRIKRILQTMRLRLQGWMNGTFLAMLFLGMGIGIGLWILGIPLSLPFGVIAGLFEVIPLFGSFIGGFLPALIALTISPVKLILVLGLFLLLNQIDTHIFQPIVVGQKVNLHPITIVIAILVMSELLGVVGLIFAIPAAVVFITILDEFTSQPTLSESDLLNPYEAE